MLRFHFLRKYLHHPRLNPSELEFLPAAVEIVERPPSPLGRLTLWVLCSLVVLVLLWSILGTVDEVAVAPGRLIPSGNVKVIQAEDKGIVKTIRVREGQRVTKGQVLAELDTTVSGVDVERVRKDIAYLALEIERLTAELEDRPFLPQSIPGLEQHDFTIQNSLYKSRMEEYRAKIRMAEDRVSQNQAALRAETINKRKNEELFGIAREREERIQSLFDQNAIARFVLLEYQSRRIELEQTIAAQEAGLEKLQFALAQSRRNLEGVKAERDREITTRMVESRRQWLTLRGELKKAEEKNRLTQLTSPVDGTLHQVAIHTIGGVVTEAQALMVVVPEGIALEAEVWASNKDIGFIRVGQMAAVKVESYDFQKYGTVEAVVTSISPDAVQDKERGFIYRVTLDLAKDHMLVNGNKSAFSPGMALAAEIKTREKRIIEFFLDPFRRYGGEALRER